MNLLIFALGILVGVWIAAALFMAVPIRRLRREIAALNAHIAVLTRRLGPWVRSSDDTFSEQEIPTKDEAKTSK